MGEARQRVDPIASRILQVILSAVGAILLFDRPWPLERTHWRLILDPTLRAWLSVCLTALGIAVAIEARVALGRNWSGRVTVKEGHELIERGPYRLVRHPIYSGLLLALTGTALLQAQPADLGGVATFGIAFALKIRLEERFLSAEFGEAYASYRKRVKALIPFVA
ncbi:MAG: methyltransferase family protein [Myxococcales bacterium]